MLEKIKSMYGEAFIEDYYKAEDPEQYEWFRTSDQHVFGILKRSITANERRLLSMLFKSQRFDNILETKIQRYWSSLLFEGTAFNYKHEDFDIPDKFYLIHFSLKQIFEDRKGFEEALDGFFSAPFHVVWRDFKYGIIVVFDNQKERHEELANIIASDFYIDMSMMVTPVTILDNIHTECKNQIKLFNLAQRIFPKKRSFYYEHLLPLALLHALPASQRKQILNQFAYRLEDEDSELTRSILVYFEHNFNLTTAAKALYIHRNSLQYRIDRFHEKTGLDPKQFNDAVIIALLFLHHQYEECE
ncbi:PucR family transcriptional regulator [Scopulibacillus cellulosilyticus]|uniref:PucR family transcriptional regulator n=1 Tax=Scopulibacillus cellulosilyticus TaxID=2665665 RepID=A0ABW2PYQ1_9BACL